jgi:hypothetical protein
VNEFHGKEYEMRYYKQIERINTFIFNEENEYLSILITDITENFVSSTSRIVQTPSNTAAFSI